MSDHKYTIEVYWENSDEEEIFVKIPARKKVCPRCDGDGLIINPNIDENGITAEEWDRDWDEESREMYVSGGYDIQCPVCEGEKLILVPDTQRITDYGSSSEKDALERYLKQQEEHAKYEQLCTSETRFIYG